MLISSAANFMKQNQGHFKGGKCCDLGDQGVFDAKYTSEIFGLDFEGLNKYQSMDLLYSHLGYKRTFVDIKDKGIKLDLNYSIKTSINNHGAFDLVTNHGTSEHIFNQASCFEAIHLLTRNKGVMFHSLNCQGWADNNGLGHGFYMYQPQFIKLLAKANGYKVIDLKYSPSSVLPDLLELTPENYPLISNPRNYKEAFPHFSLLIVLLQKTSSNDFVFPEEY